MKKVVHVVVAVLLVAVVTGCASSRVARLPDAAKYTILVKTDPGGPDVPPKRLQQHRQVCSWMERDMVNLLRKRGGYQSRALGLNETFKPAPNTYLLSIKVLKYNPGSKAARMLVGYGAGAVSLDTQFDLKGEGKEPIFTKIHGAGSSREWMNCARKVNELTLRDVTDRLRTLSPSAMP